MVWPSAPIGDERRVSATDRLRTKYEENSTLVPWQDDWVEDVRVEPQGNSIKKRRGTRIAMRVNGHTFTTPCKYSSSNTVIVSAHKLLMKVSSAACARTRSRAVALTHSRSRRRR